MRRIAVAAATAGVLLAGATQSSIGDAQTSTGPTTIQAAPVAATCSVSQAVHARFARKVYHRAHIGKHAVRRMDHMRACARSPKAAANMLRLQHRLRAARRMRLTMYCGSSTCNRRLVVHMGGPCLVSIVSAETGGTFNERIANPQTGAYGLPQALPGSKMASAGRDWATNPVTQVRWMLGYVRHYGGPCGAWAFWSSHHPGWY